MPYKPKIVTRTLTTTTVTEDLIPKNAGLTNSELDSNFLNLRDQSFSIVGDDSTGIDIRSGDTIKLTGAGGATVTASGSTITVNSGGNIGDLSVIGSTIMAPSNGDLGLQTSGDGYVHVKDKLAVAKEIYFDDYGDSAVEPPGDGNRMRILDDAIDFNAGRASIDSFRIWSRGGSGSQLYILDVNSTGDASDLGHLKIYGLSYPKSDGTNGQVLSTNGSGVLTFSNPPAGNTGNITFSGSDITTSADANIEITSPANRNIVLTAGATGNGDVFLQGGPTGAVGIRGPAEITFDTTDAVGSGNAMQISEVWLRINKGGNDLQNVFIQQNGANALGTSINTGNSNLGANALFHAELYRDVITIGDYNMTLNGSNKIQGQGTAKFNVIGSTRLDNVEIDDNKITTYNSNEDLVLDANGTGTIDFTLPTSTTIGANGAASALTANPVGYLKIKVNGTQYQVPYYNV